ncbi:Hsp20/alpha crystallin family protein [Aciditerrimonas ferrireducens]|uniref:Hsp20/alpha crystallin family protein n=2 Tax=Aciditerrimonas ferrireducens TaxID=667306 RepID=A0ABV6C4M6_9ACTN
MVVRFDSYRDLDRLGEELGGALRGRLGLLAVDAVRRGDEVEVRMDLPGVDPDSIDLVVEKNVVSVSVERPGGPQEGEEILLAERPSGRFQRQLFLGEGLDPEGVRARYADGVLLVTIPLADRARPRRVAVQRTAEATVLGSSSPQG